MQEVTVPYAIGPRQRLVQIALSVKWRFVPLLLSVLAEDIFPHRPRPHRIEQIGPARPSVFGRPLTVELDSAIGGERFGDVPTKKTVRGLLHLLFGQF